METPINSIRGFNDIKAWILLFWLAAGPGALASVLQAKGQQVVPSSQSQVLIVFNIFCE